LVTGCASTSQNKISRLNLDGIFEQYAKESYRINPLTATANNVNDFNDKLAINISEAWLKEMTTLNTRYLDTLKKIDLSRLTETEKRNIDILKYQLAIQNEAFSNHYGFYRPVDQFVFSFPQNFAVLGSGAGYIPFKTEKDYRNFISRMKYFDLWIEQAIMNMQEGLRIGNTVPKACIQKVPEQLKPLYETEAKGNMFYKPLLSLPSDIDSSNRLRLVTDYTAAINNYVRPAYRKLSDYLENTYIPQTRTTSGLIDNKDGRSEYSFWLRNYTTTNITADEVFTLGLQEVARILKEMDSIKHVTGHKGDLKSFFEYLKTDPKFFPFKTEDEVLNRYRSFEARMEPQLNRLFNLRPRAKFEVRATEKFREAAANAQYVRPSRDGKKPGIFYETVRDPQKYNYFGMETLFLHEAIPGHHYQLALQQEADIPEFRKKTIITAFAEGWGLYAESLGTGLGMFTDPYQYMGRLNNEMERAVRLVVDAGLHHKGWAREEAINYVLENQPVTDETAVQLIERYMVTAGQAVSYKIGELKMLELRRKAEKKLGAKFDIREFHDQLLEEGCLPLSQLEEKINKWIDRKTG